MNRHQNPHGWTAIQQTVSRVLASRILAMTGVGVAVLSYNPGSELVATVTRVVEAGVAADRVLIVDYASPAPGPNLVRECYPTVRIETMSTNLGYGAAMNHAAATLRARGLDRLLFLTQEAWLAPKALDLMNA